MAKLLSILFISATMTISIPGFCQFQVLEARNAYHDGKKLNRFDSLSANGIIEVQTDGFLSMVYRSGKSIELKSEERLMLDSLPIISEMTTFEFPELANILDTMYFFQGSTLAGIPQFFSIYEYHDVNKVNRRDSVCLMWQSIRSVDNDEKFGIVLTNVFDEVLADTIFVKGSKTKIFTQEFRQVREDDPDIYLLYITNGFDSDLGAAIALVDENYVIPDFCNPKTATDYVIAAFCFEKRELYEFALEYYNQAVKLSDEQIFKGILAVARRRIDRYR